MAKNKYLSYAPRILEIALVLLLAWYLIIWWSHDNKVIEAVSSVQLEKNSVAKIPVKLNELLETPLFGKVEKQVVVKKTVIAKTVARSPLDVKLRGTVVAGKRSAAVMTVGRSAETIFFIGDSLQTNVLLKAVEKEAVIVMNHGHAERIALTEGKGLSSPRINTPRVERQRANPVPDSTDRHIGMKMEYFTPPPAPAYIPQGMDHIPPATIPTMTPAPTQIPQGMDHIPPAMTPDNQPKTMTPAPDHIPAGMDHIPPTMTPKNIVTGT